MIKTPFQWKTLWLTWAVLPESNLQWSSILMLCTMAETQQWWAVALGIGCTMLKERGGNMPVGEGAVAAVLFLLRRLSCIPCIVAALVAYWIETRPPAIDPHLVLPTTAEPKREEKDSCARYMF